MDERAKQIERVYRERYVGFRNALAAVTGSYDSARDAVQEAFARALRERASFRGEGPLEAWLWRILVNRARKKPSDRPTAVLIAEAAASPSGNGSHGDDVLEAVAALPERQRLAVFLRYYADLDYRSIAEALDVEVRTVSATLHAAHASLRRTLEEVTS